MIALEFRRPYWTVLVDDEPVVTFGPRATLREVFDLVPEIQVVWLGPNSSHCSLPGDFSCAPRT